MCWHLPYPLDWTVFLGDIAIRPVTSSSSPSSSCFSRSTIVHHSQTKMAKFYLIPSLIFTGCSPTGYFLLQRERNYFSLCIHVKDLESLCECKKNCHACVSWVTTSYSPPLQVFNFFSKHWPDKALINESMDGWVLMRTRCLTETG